jgi:4-amino-4-deoxy-L-arabinose transferase-like glycosyltransferase
VTSVRIRRLLLAAALGLAFICRITALDTYGFSTDETAKLRAIDAYARGEFTANAEHPMLMKLLMWASLGSADAWNGRVPSRLHVSAESALRFPNVVAGTATAAVASGLAHVWFGPQAALAAAFLVALDPNVTAISRIGKEETLALLFFLTGIWFYERGKRVGANDPIAAQRWYTLSGGGFGLMLASKYVPHLFGMYAVFNKAAVRHAGANAPWKGRYYAAMAAVFLVCNVAVLLPRNLDYILGYVRGAHALHTGYLYAGELYVNNALSFLHGVPVTYYLHMLATKVPLGILGAAVAGAIPLVTRRGERGFIWLRVFIVLPLLGYSLFGSKFQRYALPMLLTLDLLAAVGVVVTVEWLWRRAWPTAMRTAASAVAVAAVVGGVLAAQVSVAPYYSTHQNVIGSAMAPPLSIFPEEAYDYGMREAVQAITAAAGHGAAVASEAAGVVEYYVRRSGRSDLELRSLARDGLAMHGEQWVIVQDSHLYFENAELVAHLRQTARPWQQYRLRGTPVVEVFRLMR